MKKNKEWKVSEDFAQPYREEQEEMTSANKEYVVAMTWELSHLTKSKEKEILTQDRVLTLDEHAALGFVCAFRMEELKQQYPKYEVFATNFIVTPIE